MPFKPMSRRTVLKTLGVAVALPFLEAMVPEAPAAHGAGAAAAGAKALPRRSVFVYFPNGAKMDFWKPTEGGADFELGPTLKALEPFKSKMLMFSNLADAN